MALINTDNLATALECTKSYVDSEISRLGNHVSEEAATNFSNLKDIIEEESIKQKEYTDSKIDLIKILSTSDIKKLFPSQNTNCIKYTSIDNDVVYPSSFDYEQFCAFFEYSRNENGIGTIKFDDDVLNIGSSTIENGTGVFSNTSLTSVQLPKTVTSIGESAFENCTHLTTYNIPSDTTYIGKNAFKGTNPTVIIIPESVKTIGAGAFAGNSDTKSLIEVHCNSLTPPNVIMDGETWGAFNEHNEESFIIIVPTKSVEAYKTAEGWSEYADNIISVQNNQIIYTSSDGNIVEPNNTTGFGANIVSNTYENGYGIITFDGPVTSIGGYAFLDCTSLTSITIPDSVTSIGWFAFEDCTGLINAIIPDSVTSIDKSLFVECGQLTAFYGKYASEDNRCLIVDGTLNSFAPFGLTEYTIPNSVTSIGDHVFDNCRGLTSITIPDSVTEIGWYAFSHCTGLTSVTIPDSVTSIIYNAFRDCSSLTSITIPDSVTEIGEFAFIDCTSLTSVTIGNRVTSIGSSTFRNCTSLTSVTIPDNVTKIGYYAFQNCNSLVSITIPDSVTSIGDNAFWNCSSLTSINIPGNVSEIGQNTFFNCKSLTSVTIPNNVTSIKSAAFEDCTSLTSVTIPDNVTKIGSYAFLDCTSLTSVYCQPVTPPTLSSGVFDNNSSNRIIYVPTESVEVYKTAEGWSEYAESIQGYDFSINN